MSRVAVARNYAETLLTLASREDAAVEYLESLAEVAELARTEPMFRAFLETPTVSLAEKKDTLIGVFADRYPVSFTRFLLVTLEKGRQGLLGEIEEAYRDLLNARSGRVRVSVTLARKPDKKLKDELVGDLSRVLGANVLAEFVEDERILGGLVVRVGDRLMDGSVRRQLQTLRRSLLKR